MERDTTSWPPVAYEELPWHRDMDELRFISKTARQRIRPTYQAAVPPAIATAPLHLPGSLARRTEEVSTLLARFDEAQRERGYDLPALLLRSESSASSQIENLTSSVRNVALAELSETAPHNAQIIAGNVAAMRRALAGTEELTTDQVLAIHRALIEPTGHSFGGALRTGQVWVGGTSASPHGALYVPPCAERVPGLLEDVVEFSRRTDIGAIPKAAIAHAQFETIHPFIDGNGRTGRALVHRVLKAEGVLEHATQPISAGLLHNIERYMESMTCYQEGDPLPVIEQLLDALELALYVGEIVARRIDEVLEGWSGRMRERKGSSMLRLPAVLTRQPVVNTAYLAQELGITPRAAQNLVERACGYGMLRAFGNRRRGTFYQADELIDVLEQVAGLEGIRRIIATGCLG